MGPSRHPAAGSGVGWHTLPVLLKGQCVATREGSLSVRVNRRAAPSSGLPTFYTDIFPKKALKQE